MQSITPWLVPSESISARLRVDLSVMVFMLMPILVLSLAMVLWPWACTPPAANAVWASWFSSR